MNLFQKGYIQALKEIEEEIAKHSAIMDDGIVTLEDVEYIINKLRKENG